MTTLTKILVVDDEPLLRALINQKFHTKIDSNELSFIFADNGEEALAKLRDDHEIGVVLTDIKMEKMDGLTLLHHLSNEPRLYKVVVVSAYGDMSNIRKAMEEGASDFILKPFDLRDLEAALMNVVNQYQFVKRGLESQDKLIRIENELQIAREIKKAFIKLGCTSYDHIKIAGLMIDTSAPGGNFFDFFSINEHQIGVVVAHIDSQGIPAVLHTAILQMLFRAKCEDGCDLKESIQEIYQFVLGEMPNHTLSGLFYAVCNTVSGEVSYCSRGNVLSVLIGGGQLIDIKDEGIIHLKDGEKVFITTLEEATCLDKLKSSLSTSHALDASDLVKKLHAHCFDFAPTLSRDIPMLCIEKCTEVL